MSTRVQIQFLLEESSQSFQRDIDWDGPVPSVGDVLTWELDPIDPHSQQSSRWTVTSAEFRARLEVTPESPCAAKIARVQLTVRSGAKPPT